MRRPRLLASNRLWPYFVNTTNSLHINLRPSKQCLILLLFIYSGPLVLSTLLPWPLWAIIILECCLGYSLTRNIRHYAQLRASNSIVKLSYHQETGWQLTDRQNRSHTARLLPSTRAFPWLLVLNFELYPKKTQRNILVFSDSVLPKQFRLLRLKLKLH